MKKPPGGSTHEEAALQLRTALLPVLLERAEMAEAEDLPPSLAALDRQHRPPPQRRQDPVDQRDRFVQTRRIVKARSTMGSRSVDVTFADGPILQRTMVDAVSDEVIIEVLETTGAPERDFTAISEIEVDAKPAS